MPAWEAWGYISKVSCIVEGYEEKMSGSRYNKIVFLYNVVQILFYISMTEPNVKDIQFLFSSFTFYLAYSQFECLHIFH